MNIELPTRYDASEVEAKWYLRWEEAGLFHPANDPNKPLFSVTIPPPNITGSLHMGHALCYPIQDVLGRYWRLQGRNVCILPGQDHAGIATQSVVEKQLRKEGLSGAKIGRDAFVERVWKWREESGGTILHQFRSLGMAFDWSRSRFTLDEGYAKAVLAVFIDWFERGLIYKGKRVVNWDPVLQTSVSDIETERKVVKGKLYHIRYPFVDGSGFVTIATTRPETMLADVAVAVHPKDGRYTSLVGKMLRLPLVGREIPLIADLYPDPEFGTGAVKITPAHDPNDYEVGVRHGLEMPSVIAPNGSMAEEAGKFAGLDRAEARKRIVSELDEHGYLVEIEDHEISLIVSERSGEVIEPMLSEQWFAHMKPLAEPAIAAVKEGKIKFTPERYTKVYLEWMENIRDWNISRQLWWGHRVPVYYAEEGEAFAAQSWEQAQEKAGDKKIVRQDDDVLDTWFSSGLWPFATHGWPEATESLKTYYPTSVLVTDRNIIYLWVARMIMMGLDFMHEIPFRDVYIHATVLTEDGRRMSKSLGTGVDPMEVIQKIGADALRYTLMSQVGMNQEIRYSEKRTEEARNFCNKIWNATRFVLMNLGDEPVHMPKSLEIVDRWLLSRLSRVEREARKAYEGYDMQSAAETLQKFFWDDLCDWYIEVAKPRLNNPEERNTPQWVLLQCIEAFLKMMHPLMPFITEEIYSFLPTENKMPFLMESSWPKLPQEWHNNSAEQLVEGWFAIVRAIRSARADLGISPIKPIPRVYIVGDLQGGEAVVRSQSWVEELILNRANGECTLPLTSQGVEVFVPLDPETVDLPKLVAKSRADLTKLTAELNKVKAQLDNPNFVSRAKPEAIEKANQNLSELNAQLDKTNALIEILGKIS